MRVAITGASGNTGTALLRALVEEPVVTSLLGIASRVPRANGTSTVGHPHDQAEWARIDLGADDEEQVAAALRHALGGADVVIHLAWAWQPSHDPDRLDAVNVDGTRRVLEAAAATGARHVVLASSAGVYAPSRDPLARDESWPATGIDGVLHSQQKLAGERLLDQLAETHPDMTVTRVRTPVVLHPQAASELTRTMLGHAVPPKPLRRFLPDRPPRLVWPRGTRLQAVHADDVAAAYRAIVVGRYPGTFNVAAPEVLSGQQVADAIGTTLVEVDPTQARRALSAAWRLHASPLSPDWLDLVRGVPALDASHARSTLRWVPTHDTARTLREVVEAVGRGEGIASPPLAPRKF